MGRFLMLTWQSAAETFLTLRAKARMSTARRRWRALFVLRGANSAGALVWGFAQTYVFIRVLGVDLFSRYIFAQALGLYLMVADLGVSKVAFVEGREAHLSGKMQRDGAQWSLVAAYFTLALMAPLGYLAWLTWRGDGLRDALPLTAYMLFVCLSLPWVLLRMCAYAVGRHARAEAIELGRRIVLLTLLFLTWRGLDFFVFLAGLNIAWLITFGIIISALVDPIGPIPFRPSEIWRRLRSFFARNWYALKHSAGFTAAEIAIYLLPFFFVRTAFGGGAPLVVYHTFYRVNRAGIQIGKTASDSVIPDQSEAYVRADLLGLTRVTFLAGILTAVPLLLGAALVLTAGEQIFGWLLNDPTIIQPVVRWAIVVMFIAIAVQNTAGSMLVHTGNFSPAVRLAVAILAVLTFWAALVWTLDWSIERFVLGYAIVFVLGAGAYGTVAARVIRALRAGDAPSRIQTPQYPRDTGR